jgi:nucleotide-binding universal stress UspA family protein
LLDASEEADVLVVGARGLGGFRGLLLGSVSQQCLHHATCPVTIVREGRHDFGEPIARIVVGIDGSETARQAFEWAVDAGRLHQASVEAVHAWGLFVSVGDPYGRVIFDPTPLKDAARRTLDAVVDSADTRGLPTPVTRTLSSGNAAASILHAAEGADLVVVGSRGLGGFKGLVLGSVSHHIAHHAMCPVVVVPPAVASQPA